MRVKRRGAGTTRRRQRELTDSFDFRGNGRGDLKGCGLIFHRRGPDIGAAHVVPIQWGCQSRGERRRGEQQAKARGQAS